MTPFEVKYRKLTTWPAIQREVDYSLSQDWATRASVSGVLAEIRGELERLGSSECMIETDHAAADYSRLDGAPRAEAKPATNRVALWFEAAGEMRVIRCEGHPGWMLNLKAISLTLQRNRLLRAYGTMSVAEQYGGFAALPAPGESSAPKPSQPKLPTSDAPVFPTLEAAAAYMLEMAGRPKSGKAVQQVIEHANHRREIYRLAASKVHPDKHGGNDAMFKGLSQANTMINSGGTK